MKKIHIYTLLLFSIYTINGQELFTISPIIYPKIKSEVKEDGSVFYEKFNLSLSTNKEIYYKGKLIYKCDFTEYYEYLIEVFSNENNFLLISPLPKTNSKGIATPYNIDRGLILLFDYKKNKRYYANLDNVKNIEDPESFEFVKNKSHAFMIKNIDIDNKEMVLLQGGNEIKEIRIKIYDF